MEHTYRLFPRVTEPPDIAEIGHIGRQCNIMKEKGEESNAEMDVENTLLCGKELS